jgi:site-specific DNA recombinase
MKNVVIYSRVSTDEQKEFGFSLQDQERRLVAECERKGYKVLKHYQEHYSAKDFNRPQFKQFLNDVHTKQIRPSLLLCVRYDRFSRNTYESMRVEAELRKLGIEVETIENHVPLDTPESLLPNLIQKILPEIDNLRRAENTKRGMRQAARQGKFSGKAPKGYKNDPINRGMLLVDPVVAPKITAAFEMYAAGIYSVEQVRTKLKKQDVTLSKQGVIDLLRNTAYIAKNKLKAWKNEPEEIVNALHEPLIEEDVFFLCQDILNGKKKKLTRLNIRQENFPLRGFLTCKKCGRNITGSNSKSRNGERHGYYHCQQQCGERFRADTANTAFKELLRTFEISREAQELYIKILSDVFKTTEVERTKEKEHLEKQIADLDRRIQTTTDKYIDGILDTQTFQETKHRYEAKKNELINVHVQIPNDSKAFNEYLQFSFVFSGSLTQFYEHADFEGKQRIVGSIFKEKLVYEEKNYRTAGVNEALLLMCNINNELEQKQNKNADKNVGVSTWAPKAGLEPATL